MASSRLAVGARKEPLTASTLPRECTAFLHHRVEWFFSFTLSSLWDDSPCDKHLIMSFYLPFSCLMRSFSLFSLLRPIFLHLSPYHRGLSTNLTCYPLAELFDDLPKPRALLGPIYSSALLPPTTPFISALCLWSTFYIEDSVPTGGTKRQGAVIAPMQFTAR